MSRIAEQFFAFQKEGRKGFIPFVTAGDPDLDTSRAIVLKLAELGSQVIEIGVPFSDPMADGPTIQQSSQRALQNGVNMLQVLEMVRLVRAKTDVPIVLFSYLNPLMRFGLEGLADSASEAGIDGILITDAVDDEAKEIAKTLRKRDIDLISLIAPTTTDSRLEAISKNSSGFLYAIARAGVTGARSEMTNDAKRLVERVRLFTDLPIAVGFGISTRQQIANVWKYADAAVVGSAIVAEIAQANSGVEAIERVENFVHGVLPNLQKEVRNFNV